MSTSTRESRTDRARGSPVRDSLFALAAVVALLCGCAPSGPEAAGTPAAGYTPASSIPSLETLAPAASPASPAPPAPLASPQAAIPSGYRIAVPRLGIDLAIAEGDIARDITAQRTPEGFAFHLPGTALPGDVGNTYLYAHARRGMFLALWDARVGDELSVSTPDGRLLRYIVRDIFARVAPTDISSTLPTAVERLTLQTSTGPSPTDPRFVVFAFPDDRMTHR